MANIITNTLDRIGQAIGGWLAPYMGGIDGNKNMPKEDLAYRYSVLRNYYNGDHRPQLKIEQNKQNENITQNFVGLAVDRSVSRLFRGGVKWKLPEAAKAQQEYLDKVWDLNKKEIILYQMGLHGAVYGTPFVKIRPDELIDPYTGDSYPKLVPLDTEIIRILTDPSDMDEVYIYAIKYAIGETVYWEITVRSDVKYEINTNGDVVYQSQEGQADITWSIDELRKQGSAPIEKINTTKWDYEFPPIIHWKNLPSLKNCYGDSDIDDSINVQDKSNFIVSNIGKIIKFFANPITFVFGISAKALAENKLDSPVGSLYAISTPDAKAMNLEMNSDLASSREHGANLRQSIFDISREVDISSMADKIGALTNFGLQVLWSDAIDKNDTKRQLYGDALKELNRRILVLNNMTGEQSNPGDIQWGNAIPVNIKEELDADKEALDMGIIDKETIANKYQSRYGKSWEDIKKAIDEQQQADNANNANIGATILKNFQQGKGMPSQMNAQAQKGMMSGLTTTRPPTAK